MKTVDVKHITQQKTKENHEAGFTLVEVLVVMMIIVTLSAYVFFNLAPVTDNANKVKAQSDVNRLESALEFYRLDMVDYPSQQSGLDALINLPSDALTPSRYRQGGYLRGGLPKDPWGRDYNYRYPGQHSVIDIFSYGADGVEGGEGINTDVTNWTAP